MRTNDRIRRSIGRRTTARVALVATATFFLPCPLVGVSTGFVQPASGADGARAGDARGDENAESKPGIRFNFQDASFRQVVDFFSRWSGKPVLWESDPPDGVLNYISPEEYDEQEALSVLNRILQARGVALRVNDDMLVLQKLDAMRREDIPTYVGQVPAEIADETIVTVVRPLNIAVASTLAEQLAEMVASYGSVAALPSQNALIITETAAQVRRLTGIIETLDLGDPEGVVEIVPLRHVSAEAIMKPLENLLAQKVVKFLVNQKGKQVRVEENEVAGLTMAPDVRTNSLVVKGSQIRIDQVKEVIELLDVPATAAGRGARSFSLRTLSPDQAVKVLERLYKGIEEAKRPTVLAGADPASPQVTVLGDDAAIAEASRVIAEIDGGTPIESADSGSPSAFGSDRAMRVVALKDAKPQSVIDALKGLLSPRQQAAVRMLAGPDGASIVMNGPAADVSSVAALIPVLDSHTSGQGVRIIEIDSEAPQVAIDRTRALFERERTANQDDPADFTVELDSSGTTLTLVGLARDLDRFESLLRAVEGTVVVERVVRQVELAHATPSQLAESLRPILTRALEGSSRASDGAGMPVVEPVLTPIDALDVLQVSARADDMPIIAQLIETLDRPDPSDRGMRIVSVSGADDVEAMIGRANDLYTRLGFDGIGLPELEYDRPTAQILVSGPVAAINKWTEVLEQTRALAPRPRTGRLIILERANAADVVEPLREMFALIASDDQASPTPPEITVVERTNGLFVKADSAQLEMIERLAKDLDRSEPGSMPPLRVLQVQAADVSAVAKLVRDRYDARPSTERRTHPVAVESDAATGTLIVTAHEDVFEEIRGLVSELNRSVQSESDRETMVFPLKRARAADLAAAMEKLFPEPPVPLDRRGRPMQQVRPPREILVTADQATNTLIVEAPAERRASFEELVEKLDRVEMPPQAELRTWRLDRGDPEVVAKTLNALARRGVLTRPAADGVKPIEVLIEAEPQSRTLIVAGDDYTFEQVESMLRDLSVMPIERELRTFSVERGDPEDLADRAQRLYATQTESVPGAGEVSIEVDRENGTLLIVADPEAMIRMVGVLEQLERAAGPAPAVMLIPLEHAMATDTIVFLDDLVASHLSLAGIGGPAPRFEAIERTNSILVAAQPDQHAIIRELVRGFDVSEAGSMPPLRILQVRTADARAVSGALMRQYDDRPQEERRDRPVRISADETTNTLIVAAHPEIMPEIESIVDDLNSAQRFSTEGREIRIFPLAVARAETLARTLDEMYPAPPPPLDRRGRPVPGQQQPREVVVRADPQTNSIIVDAPMQRMASFEAMVAQLDRTQDSVDTEIRTYSATHVEPVVLQTTLRQLTADGAFHEGGIDGRLPISITVEPVGRRLIISGPIASFERIEKVIEEVDAPANRAETSLRFFRLEHARADRLATMLRQVLLTRLREDQTAAAVDVDRLLDVTADPATNTLIVSAPQSLMTIAEQLIEQLDAPAAAGGASAVRVRPLRFADASEVAESLAVALPSMLSEITGLPIEASLLAVPGSNALILVGAEGDLDRVETMIQPLDASPARDATDARTFALTHAVAEELAATLETLLGEEEEIDPFFGFRGRRFSPQAEDDRDIRVVADAATNRVIVSGPPRTLSLAENLIEQLDRPRTDAETTVAVFAPSNADPTMLAETVERLAVATASSRDSGSLRDAELVVDAASRTILVAGAVDRVEQVMELLREQDERTIPAPDIDFQILSLARSDAEVTAATIERLITDESRWPRQLRDARAAGAPIAAPTVTADPATNRLLVSAPGPLMPLVTELAEELDQAANETAIDVRVFSLTRADADPVAEALREALAAEAAQTPGQPVPTVRPEPSSNAIVVAATPAMLERVGDLISELDGGAANADRTGVRTIRLKHASATQIATVLESLMQGDELPQWMRWEAMSRGMETPGDDAKIQVAADQRLNAVVITGGAVALDVASEMVAQLDVETPGESDGARTVRVLPLDGADAAELGATLEALFAGGQDGTAAAAPIIRVDGASNTLIIRATDAQHVTIAATVRSVDAAALGGMRQMQVIPIDPGRASADDVAASLERMMRRGDAPRVKVVSFESLMGKRRPGNAEGDAADEDDDDDDRTPPAGGGGSESDEATSSTGVVGSAGATQSRITSSILPSQIALMSLGWPAPDARFAAEADPSIAGDAEAAVIAVDPETNSLIIFGAPRAIDRIRTLSSQLESQLPAAPTPIRVIPLPDEVDAGRTAQLVNQTLDALPASRRGRGRAQRNETPPTTTLRERVVVISDDAMNTLVVAANDADFETVADLIAAFAGSPEDERLVIRVYPLENVTADRAAQTVTSFVAGTSPNANSRGNRNRGRQADRMRAAAVRLIDGDLSIDAVLDPDRIRISSEPATNALIVMAPEAAVPLMEGFVELIDQAPIADRAALKVFALEHANASEVRDAIRRVIRERGRAIERTTGVRGPDAEVGIDERTNTLIVTAAPEQLAEVALLLKDLDRDLGEAMQPLDIIDLAHATPSRAAETIEEAVLAGDAAMRAKTLIVPDDASGTLLVRVDSETRAEIDRVLEQIDRDVSSDLPIRTVVLERADAVQVAQAVQQFFDDRARIMGSGRGRRDSARSVSIIGQPESGTLLVAASDEDFAQVESIIETFDSTEAAETWKYRIITLEHAKVDDIRDTVQGVVQELKMGGTDFFFWPPQPQSSTRRGTVSVRSDSRLNAILLTGEGDSFSLAEELIAALDVAKSDGGQRTARVYQLKQLQASDAEDIIDQIFGDPNRPWWRDPDPSEVRVDSNRQRNTVIVTATPQEQAEIETFIAQLEADAGGPERNTEVITVEYVAADEVAETMSDFFEAQRDQGAGFNQAIVLSGGPANAIVVSATDSELATIRDLLRQLDQPVSGGDRSVEIIALARGDASAIGDILEQQFRGSGDQGARISIDSRTNSLVISAPKALMGEVQALVTQLDTRDAGVETVIQRYELESADVTNAVEILRETLDLDRDGETTGTLVRLDPDSEAVEVVARVTADPRSNSIVVSATPESIPVIKSLIDSLDEAPAAAPVATHILTLEHAFANEVALTLLRVKAWPGDGPEPEFDWNRAENQLIVSATTDQYEQIRKVITDLDKPKENARITDFVPLQYAEAAKVRAALSVFYGLTAYEADTPAKRNTSIVADPSTNSLVISADETEWGNIRALIDELDSEEYDASLQLSVIPLRYADASSVANAINQAFQGQVQGRGNNNRARRGNNNNANNNGGDGNAEGERREDRQAPTTLIEAEAWVRASAETQTNSIVVSANRQNLEKIKRIVEELDVADYAALPAPRIIPAADTDPTQLADSLNRLYTSGNEERGRRAIRIVGDPGSGTVIVRADDEAFEEIQSLAIALMDAQNATDLSVEIIPVTSSSATRVADALRDAFTEKASQRNQTLSVRVDAGGNSLVVAAPPALLEEVRTTVAELDQMSPAAGQGVFIIELENIDADEAIRVIRQIGLNRPASDGASGRLVTEPVTVTRMAGRNAIAIMANPIDEETVIALVRAIDGEPRFAEATLRVVQMEVAQVESVRDLLEAILDPANQQSRNPIADAAREQIRRWSVQGNGDDGENAAVPVELDLTVPIRLIAEPSSNTLLIGSTPANAAAVVALARMFDTVPVTDGVTVQMFPLQNIEAQSFVRIVGDMFAQGKELGRIPGTDVDAIPGGMVGRALNDDVAMSVDQRTNTVIVAGREDAVALVEVLSRRLDTDVAAGWLEPRVVQLTHADARDVAETLNAVLVEGRNDLNQATPLQNQVGRLRVIREREADDTSDGDGAGNGDESPVVLPPEAIESQLFQPMSRLVIRPEESSNAILLVGTPDNLEVVGELIAMLDVESAAADSVVRIYPIQHASAAQIATTVNRIFNQQVRSGAIRERDRVLAQSDERTNALIVSTSPRSFAVLEALLQSLDTEMAPELQSIQRIAMEHASAGRVADLVQEMMDARVDRLRRVQPETAELERAVIVPDARTNSLIVAAGPESLAVIRTLVEDLDQSTLDAASLVDVIDLESGDAEELAETVQQIMERRYADLPGDMQRSQRPLILTDARSNSLLVAAAPEDVDAIRELVGRLESTPSDPAVGLHVLQLPAEASAQGLADRVQRLMESRRNSLGSSRPSDRVTIEADPSSNTLIVASNREQLAVIEGLVDVLVASGEDAADGRELDVLTLVSSRADEIVELVEALYIDEIRENRGENAVSITADERINAVIVKAAPSDVEAIRSLVERLDGERPSTVVEIRTFSLTSANAIETVSLLERVLAGGGLERVGRNGSAATVLRYLRTLDPDDPTGEDDETAGDDSVGEAAELEVSSAIRASIQLTPDVRTNSIVVRAPADAMALLERLIIDLDSSTTGAKNIRIFNLQNADALAMADVLGELFNLRQGRDLFVLKPTEGGVGATSGDTPGGDGSGVGFSGTELTAVPDSRQQLAITVDSRTNSLLVSGSPRYLELVAEVVDELDALDANERDVFTYQLRNAVASDVAQVIQDFVEREQEKLIATLGTDQLGSAARLLEREVTISGDESSNAVIVSASPRYTEQVRRLIEELDVDPPQVLLQVMLAEISLDSLDEWGVNLTTSFGIDNLEFGGSYGLASALVTSPGVPTLTVSASDFSMMIEAIKSQGRVQVLSNPSIMAANNEEADLLVGETIRVPERTNLSDSGNVNTTTIEQEIGVRLNVRPTINPDGYVRMVIEPEISSLTDRTTQINEDLSSPIITVRRARTTVTVQDGQTIVIGGLISDRFERRKSKVPVLGDVPFIGPLFRAERERTSKTELLIVLTPHVIQSPRDHRRVDDMTDAEIDRLTLPDTVLEQLRNGRFESSGLYDAQGNPLNWGEAFGESGREVDRVIRQDSRGAAAPETSTTRPIAVSPSAVRPDNARRRPQIQLDAGSRDREAKSDKVREVPRRDSKSSSDEGNGPL